MIEILFHLYFPEVQVGISQPGILVEMKKNIDYIKNVNLLYLVVLPNCDTNGPGNTALIHTAGRGQ